MEQTDKARAAALWQQADSIGSAVAPPASFLNQNITQHVQLKPLQSIKQQEAEETVIFMRNDGTRSVHVRAAPSQRQASVSPASTTGSAPTSDSARPIATPSVHPSKAPASAAVASSKPKEAATATAGSVPPSNKLAGHKFKSSASTPKASTPAPANSSTREYQSVAATLSTLPSGVLKVQEWPYRPDRMQRPDGKHYTVDKKTGTKKRVYREEDRYSSEWLKERVNRIKSIQEDKMFGFMRMVAGFTNSDVDSDFLDDTRGSRALAGAIRGQQQQQQQRAASKLITGMSSVTRMWSGQFSLERLRDKLLTKISRRESDLRSKLQTEKTIIDETAHQVWNEFVTEFSSRLEQYLDASDEDVTSQNPDVGPEPITGNTKQLLKEKIVQDFGITEPVFNNILSAYTVSGGRILAPDTADDAPPRDALQRRQPLLYEAFLHYCTQQIVILQDQERQLNATEDEEDNEALEELVLDMARFRIAVTGKLPNNQVERNPAYPSLRQLFADNNNAPSEAHLRMWDIQHNNGELFAKLDRKVKRQAMQVAELEWIELPENLGYFFMKPIFEAAMRAALRDVHDVCGAQQVPYMDLMCHELVRTDFAELVAMHVLETRQGAPNRHQFASNRKYITERMFLLKQKFKKLYYYGGFLAYRGLTNMVQVQQRRRTTLQRTQYTERTGTHYTDMDLDALPRSMGGSGRNAAGIGTTLSDMQFFADGGRQTHPRRLVNDPSAVSFEQFRTMNADLPINNRTRLAVQADMEIASAGIGFF